MNLEGQEQMRHEFLQVLVQAMTKVLKDDNTKVQEKIDAGKLLDAISDTIVKAHLMSQITNMEDKSRGKMISQLEKLDNHEH